MAEPFLSNVTNTVVAKSKLLSFSQICNKLGIQNDMECLVSAMSDFEPHLMSVQEEQALWLKLKTKFYEAEDMLDNLDNLRDILTEATQAKVGELGHSGDLLRWLDDPAECGGRNRVDLFQRMRRTVARPREHSESGGKRRIFVLNVICRGWLLRVFVAFILGFCAGVVV